MNRIKGILLAIAGACFAFQGMLAHAGIPPGKTDASATASTGRASDTASTGRTSDTAVRTREVRASKLLGRAVRGSGGRNLGEISDLIVDSSNGHVHYAMLSVGGFLGMGDKQFAVPLSALDVDPRGRLTIDVDRDRLQSAPAIDAGRWPHWSDRRRVLTRDGPGEVNGRFRRASDIIRTKVMDSHGGEVGKVKDLVVDLGSSRVRYVVVDFDRAWTPNDKLVALPPTAFADGASTSAWQPPEAEGAGAPRNAPPALALLNPGEPTKGTASAVNPEGSLATRPLPVDPNRGATIQALPDEPLQTTTSYADDEALVFRGTREGLRDAPAFEPARYPD